MRFQAGGSQSATTVRLGRSQTVGSRKKPLIRSMRKVNRRMDEGHELEAAPGIGTVSQARAQSCVVAVVARL